MSSASSEMDRFIWKLSDIRIKVVGTETAIKGEEDETQP